MTRSVVQLGGQALKLDADGDTTIQVNTDDVLVVDTAGNEAMTIDASGRVTKALQPCFLVQKNTQQQNLSTGSYIDVTFELERFDVGSNFASNVFTAPVTGKYQLNLNLRIDSLDTDSLYTLLYLTTSNRGYYHLVDTDVYSSDLSYHVFTICTVADMDANDTAKSQIYVAGGAAQSDIDGSTSDPVTWFSGYLLG
tara:strand:+ start:327 stop:914 length:588 start_codon:yes stop_codon:yes gene_type:complete